MPVVGFPQPNLPPPRSEFGTALGETAAAGIEAYRARKKQQRAAEAAQRFQAALDAGVPAEQALLKFLGQTDQALSPEGALKIGEAARADQERRGLETFLSGDKPVLGPTAQMERAKAPRLPMAILTEQAKERIKIPDTLEAMLARDVGAGRMTQPEAWKLKHGGARDFTQINQRLTLHRQVMKDVIGQATDEVVGKAMPAMAQAMIVAMDKGKTPMSTLSGLGLSPKQVQEISSRAFALLEGRKRFYGLTDEDIAELRLSMTEAPPPPPPQDPGTGRAPVSWMQDPASKVPVTSAPALSPPGELASQGTLQARPMRPTSFWEGRIGRGLSAGARGFREMLGQERIPRGAPQPPAPGPPAPPPASPPAPRPTLEGLLSEDRGRILDRLSEDPQLGPRIRAAMARGATDEQIMDSLARKGLLKSLPP